MSVSQFLFAFAGGISALWFGVHMLLGGKEVAGPLRADPHLDPVLRDTLYMCWHLVSFTVALMSALFFVAIGTTRPEFAMVGSSLAWGFTAIALVLVPSVGARFRDLPQGWLFLPVAVLGTAGLLL